MKKEAEKEETEKEKDDNSKPIKVGEIVKGKIINKGKASVFLELGNRGTGIIYGKEFYEAKNKLKKLKKGNAIFVKIIDLENEEGFIELSLTKAGKEIAWEELKQKKGEDEIIAVKIIGANKGGLLAKVFDIPAFLPVSQLSSEKYPKVEGGDSQKILKALQKFVGQEIKVKIFDFDEKEEKLILSEKEKDAKKIKEVLKNYKIGDVVEAEVTGIVDFGVFVKFSKPNLPDSLEGLIHISELDWQLIEEPSETVKIGENVQAKIIDISNNRISLSLKALKKDPWENIEKKFQKGDIIKGKATKFNPFGAFVQLAPKIQGLCHISEFGSPKKMEETVKIGESYNFKILLIDPKEHRITLALALK